MPVIMVSAFKNSAALEAIEGVFQFAATMPTNHAPYSRAGVMEDSFQVASIPMNHAPYSKVVVADSIVEIQASAMAHSGYSKAVASDMVIQIQPSTIR